MMKYGIRNAVLAAALVGLSAVAFAGNLSDAETLDLGMTPGGEHAALNSMVGTFDVHVKVWADPSATPVEETLSCINSWVLDGRWIRSTLAGDVAGEPFNGIGFYGFDRIRQKYEAVWMDTGSTGLVYYKGEFDSDNHMTMRAEVPNPLTGDPTLLELRVTIGKNGEQVTEMWGTGMGDMMFKMMELTYTRKAG
jgi:hypothetical protein